MSKSNKPFSVSKDWTDSIDFPTTEYSESRVRSDIQLLFDEIKTFINDRILGAINDNASKLAAIGAGGEVTHELMGADSVGADNIIDGSITEPKYGNNSIPNEAYQDGSITSDKFDEEEVTEFIKELSYDTTLDSIINDDDTTTAIKEIVKNNSSKETQIYFDSYMLSSMGYSSSGSYVTMSMSASSLGLDTVRGKRIRVEFWANPGNYSRLSFPSVLMYFEHAYGINVADDEICIYMRNTSPGTGENYLEGNFRIYLMEV